MKEIDRLACEIDALDEMLASVLEQRFRRSRRIGALKAEADLLPWDPERVAIQTRHFAELCERRGLDSDVCVAIFESIIRQVLKERGVFT